MSAVLLVASTIYYCKKFLWVWMEYFLQCRWSIGCDCLCQRPPSLQQPLFFETIVAWTVSSLQSLSLSLTHTHALNSHSQGVISLLSISPSRSLSVILLLSLSLALSLIFRHHSYVSNSHSFSSLTLSSLLSLTHTFFFSLFLSHARTHYLNNDF